MKYLNFRFVLMTLVLVLLLMGCGQEPGGGTQTPELKTPTPLIVTNIPATPTPVTKLVIPTVTPDPQKSASQPTESETTVPTSATVSKTAVQEKYQFLGQSLPDGTQILPNRLVTITWTIQNVGTTAWTPEFVMRYFSGVKPRKDSYPFPNEVPPNHNVNLTATFTTPQALGDYDLWLKLTNNQGQNFGDLNFSFKVTNNPVNK